MDVEGHWRRRSEGVRDELGDWLQPPDSKWGLAVPVR
jgi:hypothetical protein